jgi:hypothetical protein
VFVWLFGFFFWPSTCFWYKLTSFFIFDTNKQTCTSFVRKNKFRGKMKLVRLAKLTHTSELARDVFMWGSHPFTVFCSSAMDP